MAGALLSAMALATTLPPPAQAQIRRCTTPDGGTVYTDRSCDAMGAVESRPPVDVIGRNTLRYRGGCARRLQDLVFNVSAAIDARDGNRLALSYHWAGMGHRAGYAMADRLDAISQRPLVDITLLGPPRPAVTYRPTTPPSSSAAATPASSTWPTDTAVASVTSMPPPAPAAPRRPVALRIDQVLGDGVTPSATTFQLRRHMDCWWISL